MAKAAFDALDLRMRGILKDKSWSLCLGAGVSNTIMPSWEEFARRALNATSNLELSEQDFKNIASDSGWGFDAWLQTALNNHLSVGGTEETFAELIESVLYQDLREMAIAADIEADLITSFLDPHLLRKDKLKRVFSYLSSTYSKCSAIELAKFIVNIQDSNGVSPKSIITFNYDTILDSVLRMYSILLNEKKTNTYQFPRKTHITVADPLCDWNGKIPIYHLHGCLPPKRKSGKKGRRKLRYYYYARPIVAQESTYSKLAGSIFTWPQTTFLHYAQSSTMVFVGLSMSDQNIRKWMAWCAEAKNSELSAKLGESRVSFPHIWITKRPSSQVEVKLFERSLIHLGVRIAWIDSWSDLTKAIANLLAVSESGYPHIELP